MPRRKLDPLPSTAFNILLALAGEDLHGYAIMRQVEEQTRGRVRLGPGTLYGSLRTLLEAGLIEELENRSGAKDSAERRRYYRLTPAAALRKAEGEIAEFRRFQTLTGELIDINRKICRLRPVEDAAPQPQEKKRLRRSNRKLPAK